MTVQSRSAEIVSLSDRLAGFSVALVAMDKVQSKNRAWISGLPWNPKQMLYRLDDNIVIIVIIMKEFILNRLYMCTCSNCN